MVYFTIGGYKCPKCGKFVFKIPKKTDNENNIENNNENNIENLIKLSELLNSGILTKDEFEKEKRKILK